MLNNDPDLSNISAVLDDGDDLYIVLYALSFGRQNTFTQIYSKAVCLQYITINYTEDNS